MKHFLLLSALGLIALSFIPGEKHSTSNFKNIIDSGIISHELDGSLKEWPAQKFELDGETGIKYAVDNDKENLYIAMSIPSFPVQMRIMGLGMNLYIDMSGKKNEEKGIEYPVQNGTAALPMNTRSDNNQIPDKSAIRGAMAMNLVFLKLFGFSEGEPVKQSIEDGNVNIQFSWDAADIMNIEYKIPLATLAGNSQQQKTISLGWKLNIPQPGSFGRAGSSSSQVVALPAGRSPGGRGGSGNRSKTVGENTGQMKEQSFWTKYTISIPSK